MDSNIFNLNLEQLKAIAIDFQHKIETGLAKDNTEILCIPTYISPKTDIRTERILVLDWGGTNFRVAIIEFKNGKPAIIENLEKLLSAEETKGFSQEDLLKEMADLIGELENLDNSITRIGYCFSYPADSTLDGDAKLLRWTKEINIPEMVNELAGKTLLDYLNQHKIVGNKTQFKTIKVVNDTVACLFAGLAEKGFDTYIGLIVGTGTNMAGLVRPNSIPKLNKAYTNAEPLPVNLESGNLIPSPNTSLIDKKYLTEIDKIVDEVSNNKGQQIFEKAISGRYLSEIFRHVFPNENFGTDFDTKKLTDIMNNIDGKQLEHSISIARQIYNRSAQLVAASIFGLAIVLTNYDKSIKNICLAAEGGLFWGQPEYSQMVSEVLQSLLADFGLKEVQVKIIKLNNANLIGSAIAALA